MAWEVLLQMWSSFPPAGQMSQSSPDSMIHHPSHQSPGTSKHFSLLNKLSSDADFQIVIRDPRKTTDIWQTTNMWQGLLSAACAPIVSNPISSPTY